MLVAETFASLQGEGMLAGVPSYFIRTAGCNLRCVWCDTPYASWRPEGVQVDVETLVHGAKVAGLAHVVVTGGEPLVQRDLGPLTRALAGAGVHVTVETAGTVERDFVCDLLSVSPKTGNSDPVGPWHERHRRRRLDRAPLEKLLARFPEHQLKFVVRGEEDMAEVVALVQQVGAQRRRVLLMPEGRTSSEVAMRAGSVAALCLAQGFRFCPRLHLDLYGGRRGA